MQWIISMQKEVTALKLKLVLIMTVLSLVILLTPAVAQADVSVFVNEQPVHFDGQPKVDQRGNIMVPFRPVFAAMGAEVWYSNADDTANAQQDGLHIILPIGEAKAIVNGEEIQLNTIIDVINGNTMIPFSLITDTINYDVVTKEESGDLLLYLNYKPRIVVGSDISYPPFEFIDEDTGEYVGFDIDLINAIAKEADLNIEIKNISFDQLVPSLRNNTIDVIISAMTITEHREKVMNFTEPYFESGLCIVVNSNNDTIQGVTQLAGKTVAVIGGTLAQSIAEQELDGHLRSFGTVNEALAALKSNQVDAFIENDVFQINKINLTENNLEVLGERLTTESLGIAARLHDTELLTKLNQGLKEIKESGEYADIYNKWLNAENAK
ncbi:transporter substrate-binding domain-containing protein [Peptococcaceae bacterium 1198_IL3148]